MILSWMFSRKMAGQGVLAGLVWISYGWGTVGAAEVVGSASGVVQAGHASKVSGKGGESGTGKAGEPRVELERLDARSKRSVIRANGNAFGAKSWYVPPPQPVVKPAPPPPPSAPPVPFVFLGTYEQSARKVIMLVKGDQVYTVSVGDTIDNTYRIDKMEMGAVEITYLPLDIKQSINTGN